MNYHTIILDSYNTIFPEFSHLEDRNQIRYVNLSKRKHKLELYGVITDRRNGRNKSVDLLLTTPTLKPEETYIIPDMSIFDKYKKAYHICKLHKTEPSATTIFWDGPKPEWNDFGKEIRKLIYIPPKPRWLENRIRRNKYKYNK